MHRIGRWLDTRARSPGLSAPTMDAIAEAQNMEVALRAAELIMNDDIQGAEEQLSHGSSAFHKLARGTLGFIKATLGFEAEIMKQATETLAEAENTAYQFHQKAQNDPHAFSSSIYEKGSEFALCQAEAQIMAAVVGVLNENIMESLKGFYKLRKAYFTIDSLAQQEQAFMKKRGIRSTPISRQQSSESVKSVKSFHSVKAGAPPGLSVSSISSIVAQPTTPTRPSTLRSATSVNDIKEELSKKETKSDSSDDADEFFDADEKNSRSLDHESPLPSGLNTPPSGFATPNLPMMSIGNTSLLTADADSDVFSNSLDVFIHSGVNLMSGVINLMLSVIPPAFSRLLAIVGFRGDREKGLRMLWQASKFSNVNGGMAALILFGWYNGLIGLCDIVSDSDPTIPDDVNGFPIERLAKLLIEMRQRYPDSYLWKLEEARMYSNGRELHKAIAMLNTPGEKPQMKQLEALAMFELSLNSMNAHDYPLCAKSFLNCIDLNQWSPALYHYAAAAAYFQIYRDNKGFPGKEAIAEENRKLAVKHFREAPTQVGKKKMMGKPMPFDGFVSRKIAKWNARAQSWGVDFVDAIGVSPIEEVAFLWNGYKKMNHAQLEQSLRNLAWSEDPTKNPNWQREELDEKSILALLRSSVLRNLRQHEKARAVLQETIICHDPTVFKGPNKDEWTAPAAYYEMAVNYWMERNEYRHRYGTSLAGADYDAQIIPTEAEFKADAVMVAEAKRYVEKVKNWGSYELDTRIGMKVTAGYNAIMKWESKHKDIIS